MIFWRSDIIFHLIQIPTLNKLETIALKLKIGNKWLLVIGAYSPPNINSTIWYDALFRLLNFTSLMCDDLLLLGDLNCNLMDPDAIGGSGRDLIELCDIFNLECLIDKPTRVNQLSETLIDVILTNNRGRFLSSGVFEPHLSDHSLVYTVMTTFSKYQRSRKITCRNYKNYNRDRWLEDLALVPFHVISVFDDVSDQAWAFSKLFTDAIETHAPLKQFHLKGGHVPYMTPQWCRAIRHRNRLWHKII